MSWELIKPFDTDAHLVDIYKIHNLKKGGVFLDIVFLNTHASIWLHTVLTNELLENRKRCLITYPDQFSDWFTASKNHGETPLDRL